MLEVTRQISKATDDLNTEMLELSKQALAANLARNRGLITEFSKDGFGHTDVAYLDISGPADLVADLAQRLQEFGLTGFTVYVDSEAEMLYFKDMNLIVHC